MSLGFIRPRESGTGELIGVEGGISVIHEDGGHKGTGLFWYCISVSGLMYIGCRFDIL
jgi:hypothetical protein